MALTSGGRPARDEHRTYKVQVCLTPAERERLTEIARSSGFGSVAAYVRAKALYGVVTPAS